MTKTGELRAQVVLGIASFICVLAFGCGDDSSSGGDAGPDACVGECGDGGPEPQCEIDDDCAAGTCEGGECVDPPECDDGDDCLSGICDGNACAAATCDDTVKNGDETDTDCGGPDCDPCELEASCVEDDDCASMTCTAMVCVAGGPSCTDEEQNGEETDVDCGGPDCEPCAVDSECTEDDECESLVCDDGVCAEATCEDDTQNGEETDQDCGGPSCDPCGDTLGCAEPADCASGVCGEDDTCSAPSCDDGVQNGDETGEDCGGPGSCDRCGQGAGCEDDSDCASDICEATECVDEPTAGFTLTTLFADVGQELTATSTAVSGGGDITTVEYDWGAGFGAEATHTFDAAGDFPVTQRVTDEFGLTATTMLMVDVFDPVQLSTIDKTANVIPLEGLIELRMDHNQSEGGVRSDVGVATGSGVSYFEMTQLGRTGGGGFGAGVATAAAPLNSFLGSSTQSIGMNANGIVWYNSGFLGNFGHSDTVGFVVDYRGANPIVHVISQDSGGTSIRRVVQTLTGITAPVFAAFSGSPESHGPIARFNFGSDTENHPFTLDPVAALNTAGATTTASALTMGFGRTRARPASDAPELTVSDDLTVAVNTEVELTASATDEEDGTLTSAIEWENLAQSYYIRETGAGGTFTFTPTEVGIYPIRAAVADVFGVVSEETVMVTVTGDVPQFDPVRLVVNDDTGSGVMLDPTGLQALYTVNEKMGVRANQGIYGDFWYFETRRLVGDTENIGSGLVVSYGSLDPLDFETTQPSLQVNFIGSTWRDLIFQANTPSASGYYGFAVDYRDIHPTIYLIVSNVVVYRTTLEHVWVPLYPMLYGNPTSAAAAFDNSINFGATAFQNNPVTALTALPDDVIAPEDIAELEVGWGDANTD